MVNILVLAGASASGKTTVARSLTELDSRFEMIRSVTTRKKRNDGFDSEYIYISEEEFRSLIENGGVIEYTEYGGFLYGTPRSEIDRVVEAGKIPLLILELNGVRACIGEGVPFNACCVYLYDHIDVLEKRLYDRYLARTPSVEKLASFVKRKEQNISDYKSMLDNADLFYAFVCNREIASSAEMIASLFCDFTLGVSRDLDSSRKVAESLSLMAKEKEEQ